MVGHAVRMTVMLVGLRLDGPEQGAPRHPTPVALALDACLIERAR